MTSTKKANSHSHGHHHHHHGHSSYGSSSSTSSYHHHHNRVRRQAPDGHQKTTILKMKRRCPLIGCMAFCGFGFLGCLCLAMGGLLYMQFDSLFGDTVKSQMVISDDVLWWYERWLHPPVRETLTVHMFQVENAADIQQSWLELLKPEIPKPRQQQKPSNPNRIKPQMREVGPFVFRMERLKEQTNYTDTDKQQIGYIERTRYHFDPLLSYEDLDHTITVVNAELAALNPFIRMVIKRSQSVARISQGLRSIIDSMLGHYAMNIFVERPIWRVLFGPNYNPLDDNNEADQDPVKPSQPSIGRSEPAAGADGDQDFVFEDDLSDGGSDHIDPTVFTNDEAVLEILKLYNKAEPYLKRLGVDVDPYHILQDAYKYQIDGRNLLVVDKIDQMITKQRLNSRQTLDKMKNKKKSSNLESTDATAGGYYKSIWRENSVWAFFVNNSLEKYDVYTGVNTDRNAEIIRWNHHTYMDTWFGKWCNMINGTDGRQYKPFLKQRRIYHFIPRLCRSIPLTLSDTDLKSSPSEIRMHRYRRANDFMQSPYRNQENGCFCRFQQQLKRCNYDGILDLANCYHGAPIILTNPHFSGTITKSIARSINGLTPDDKNYQTYVDVEPVSGIVLDKVERFQFNVHFPPMPLRLNLTRSLPELIIPLFWYQEQWQANSEYQSQISYLFIYPTQYQEYGIMVLIAIGLLMFLLAMISVAYCCCTWKPATPKINSKVAQETNNKLQTKQPNNSSQQKLRRNKSIDTPLAKSITPDGAIKPMMTVGPNRPQPQSFMINPSPMQYISGYKILNNLSSPQDSQTVMSKPSGNKQQQQKVFTINTSNIDNFAEKMIELFPNEFDHGRQQKQTTDSRSNRYGQQIRSKSVNTLTADVGENISIPPVDDEAPQGATMMHGRPPSLPLMMMMPNESSDGRGGLMVMTMPQQPPPLQPSQVGGPFAMMMPPPSDGAIIYHQPTSINGLIGGGGSANAISPMVMMLHNQSARAAAAAAAAAITNPFMQQMVVGGQQSSNIQQAQLAGISTVASTIAPLPSAQPALPLSLMQPVHYPPIPKETKQVPKAISSSSWSNSTQSTSSTPTPTSMLNGRYSTQSNPVAPNRYPLNCYPQRISADQIGWQNQRNNNNNFRISSQQQQQSSASTKRPQVPPPPPPPLPPPTPPGPPDYQQSQLLTKNPNFDQQEQTAPSQSPHPLTPPVRSSFQSPSVSEGSKLNNSKSQNVSLPPFSPVELFTYTDTAQSPLDEMSVDDATDEQLERLMRGNEGTDEDEDDQHEQQQNNQNNRNESRPSVDKSTNIATNSTTTSSDLGYDSGQESGLAATVVSSISPQQDDIKQKRSKRSADLNSINNSVKLDSNQQQSNHFQKDDSAKVLTVCNEVIPQNAQRNRKLKNENSEKVEGQNDNEFDDNFYIDNYDDLSNEEEFIINDDDNVDVEDLLDVDVPVVMPNENYQREMNNQQTHPSQRLGQAFKNKLKPKFMNSQLNKKNQQQQPQKIFPKQDGAAIAWQSDQPATQTSENVSNNISSGTTDNKMANDGEPKVTSIATAAAIGGYGYQWISKARPLWQ